MTTSRKERPILFSGPMVLAILDGRKTQTRRVIREQDLVEVNDEGKGFVHHPKCESLCEYGCAGAPDPWSIGYSKYGVPGDRLWVKETWRVGAWNEDNGTIAVDYKAENYSRTEYLKAGLPEDDGEQFNRLWNQSCTDAEKARMKLGEDGYDWKPGESPCRWRPSIFMPRWASRILLEITDVRVQRVQEISEEDAICEVGQMSKDLVESEYGGFERPHKVEFMNLWNHINGKRGFGWDVNPWVWCISFRRIK